MVSVTAAAHHYGQPSLAKEGAGGGGSQWSTSVPSAAPGRRLPLPQWLLPARLEEEWSAGLAIRLLADTEVEPIRREPYIISGYLPPGSFALCLRALFLPTNECFNSWSALLPALFYLWQTRYTVETPGGTDPRPYQLLLLSVALSSLASFLAHGFSAV